MDPRTALHRVDASSAAQLRLRCILELLVSSGIRLAELAQARRSDLRLEALPDLADTWVLSVTGKRATCHLGTTSSDCSTRMARSLRRSTVQLLIPLRLMPLRLTTATFR